MTSRSAPDRAATDGKRSGVGTILRKRLDLILWLLVGVAVLAMFWPSLKGQYYRVSGAQVPDDGIPWTTDYSAALAESAKTGKPVLLDFTASWCPPCQVMKHEVWPDADVRQAIIDGYIPVLLDVDHPDSAVAARRYDITGIPAILIVNSAGDILRQGAFMDRSQMLSLLKPDPHAG